MKRGDKKRKYRWLYPTILVVGLILLFSVVSYYFARTSILSSGLYPVEDSLVQAGYSKTKDGYTKNILRLVVKKSPTGESTHYFFFMLK